MLEIFTAVLIFSGVVLVLVVLLMMAKTKLVRPERRCC